MSLEGGRDKQNVVHTYTGVLHNTEKEKPCQMLQRGWTLRIMMREMRQSQEDCPA